jgi:hypothetical protein
MRIISYHHEDILMLLHTPCILIWIDEPHFLHFDFLRSWGHILGSKICPYDRRKSECKKCGGESFIFLQWLFVIWSHVFWLHDRIACWTILRLLVEFHNSHSYQNNAIVEFLVIQNLFITIFQLIAVNIVKLW